MILSELLRQLVILVTVPSLWLTVLVLLLLIWKDRRNGVLIGATVLVIAFAVRESLYAFVFVSNDQPIPWLDPEQTRVLTRGGSFFTGLVAIVAVVWIWFIQPWRRRRRK